jgi:cysteinyl-tRNA synthetase
MHQRFIAAMDDDLNTSGALAVLFDLAKPLRAIANRLDRGDNSDLPTGELQGLLARWQLLRELAAALGLRWEQEPDPADADDDVEIEAAVEARRTAKASKNYAEADRIRDELSQRGIELIDRPGGVTEWIRS